MTQGSPQQEIEMEGVKTIQFTQDSDPDLMVLINTFAREFNRCVMRKTPPRNAIRNLLFQVLPTETEAIKKGKKAAG